MHLPQTPAVHTGAEPRQSPLLQQWLGLQPPSGVVPWQTPPTQLLGAHCGLLLHGPHCPAGR